MPGVFAVMPLFDGNAWSDRGQGSYKIKADYREAIQANYSCVTTNLKVEEMILYLFEQFCLTCPEKQVLSRLNLGPILKSEYLLEQYLLPDRKKIFTFVQGLCSLQSNLYKRIETTLKRLVMKDSSLVSSSQNVFRISSTAFQYNAGCNRDNDENNRTVSGRIIRILRYHSYKRCENDMKALVDIGSGRGQCPTCKMSYNLDSAGTGIVVNTIMRTDEGQNERICFFKSNIMALLAIILGRIPDSSAIDSLDPDELESEVSNMLLNCGRLNIALWENQDGNEVISRNKIELAA